MEGTKKEKAGSKLSVERVYQKKTPLEHILLRPDTYVGSVEPVTQVSQNELLLVCKCLFSGETENTRTSLMVFFPCSRCGSLMKTWG